MPSRGRPRVLRRRSGRGTRCGRGTEPRAPAAASLPKGVALRVLSQVGARTDFATSTRLTGDYAAMSTAGGPRGRGR